MEDPVDSQKDGDIGRIILAQHPEGRRHDDLDSGLLLAGRKQQPPGALRIIGRERRPFQQLGGLVAAVLGMDTEREEVVELIRRVCDDLPEFTACLEDPALTALPL